MNWAERIVAGLLFYLSACGQKADPAVNEKSATAYPDVEATELVASSRDLICDPKTNPGVDCACFDNMMASNWSDDIDSDISTILANPPDDFPQELIDALIDVAFQTDDKCIAQK